MYSRRLADVLDHPLQHKEPALDTAESESFNPYAAPLVAPEPPDPFQQDDMRIRQQFIGCESNVRSIGVACLWYLLRPAAKYVFTPEYRDVIRRTPQVHFQTSAVSWGILITVLLGVLALVAVSTLRL